MSHHDHRFALMERARELKDRSHKTRADWWVLGDALEFLKAEAMKETSGRYDGKRTGRIFQKLIRQEGLELQSSTHTFVMKIMKYRDEIEIWLETLPAHKRNTLNSPQSLWHRFEDYCASNRVRAADEIRADLRQILNDGLTLLDDPDRLPRDWRLVRLARNINTLAREVRRVTLAENQADAKTLAKEFVRDFLAGIDSTKDDLPPNGSGENRQGDYPHEA